MNIQQIPGLRGMLRVFEKYYQASKLYIPPGHYYSPIINRNEIQRNADRIFNFDEPKGVDLNEANQISLLKKFKPYYDDFVSDWKNNRFSFYTPDNGFYGPKDGIFLYSMIRHFKPKRIIEVGSGYSSALMEDTRQLYSEQTSLLFIEPYPEERLQKLVKNKSNQGIIKAAKVQDLDPDTFSCLEENDILFIDSSHVSKVGSDVNYLFFQILPALKSGVLIHFHDVYFPFEYPKNHVLGKSFYSWNEAYLLKAFLSYNSNFEILLWNSFLEYKYKDLLINDFPEYFNRWGASIWIRKL